MIMVGPLGPVLALAFHGHLWFLVLVRKAPEHQAQSVHVVCGSQRLPNNRDLCTRPSALIKKAPDVPGL